jgi:flagellar basal body P-ring formation protein FlgA
LGSVNSPSLRPALPALALLLVCAAQAQTAAVPPAAMQRALALAQSVAAAIAPQDARVVALPGVADPRLMLAPCAQVDVYLPAGVPPWGRTRVGLRCTSGPVRWNVFMPITVQVLAPALALNTALPAGARITESQLQRVQADWGALPQPPFAAPESLLGRTLARPVASTRTGSPWPPASRCRPATCRRATGSAPASRCVCWPAAAVLPWPAKAWR